jgi:hypothetical protein
MVKNPQPPPQLTAWSVFKIAHYQKAMWLGIVDAPNEEAAIEKAAGQLEVPATRPLVVRR